MSGLIPHSLPTLEVLEAQGGSAIIIPADYRCAWEPALMVESVRNHGLHGTLLDETLLSDASLAFSALDM
jgi:hypothetical protein